jgi:MFS family permease
VVGGIITDHALRKTGNLKWSRRGVAIAAMAGAAIAIIPAALLEKPIPVIICLILCNFFVSLCSAPSWATSMDIAGGYAGTVSAVMNMIGQFAGSLSAIIFGILVQKGFWVAPFFIMAAVLLGVGLLWLFVIDPERTVLQRS